MQYISKITSETNFQISSVTQSDEINIDVHAQWLEESQSMMQNRSVES